MRTFPFYRQHDNNDCGPACLQMISKFHGKYYNLNTLRERCTISRDGVSLANIALAAESIGFKARPVKVKFEALKEMVKLPCIVHWSHIHFVVVYKISKTHVYCADPAKGMAKYTIEYFRKLWEFYNIQKEPAGLCLELDKRPDFYDIPAEKRKKVSFEFIRKYFKDYNALIVQLFVGILIAVGIQIVLPFLFQTIVDKGVVMSNLNLIKTIFFAQLVLVISRFGISYLRSWIVLHLATRVNLLLVSDFLIKMMNLPITYFQSRSIGDLMQRTEDHKRIENFLTNTSIQMIFSLITLFIMGVVLAIFSFKLFFTYFGGITLYLAWSIFLMKKRKQLDIEKFEHLSGNKNKLIQMVSSVAEIKLNNAEALKRWEWEEIQTKMFNVNIRSLKLLQLQRTGAFLFNEVKDILVIFISAKMVLEGHLTIGSLVSISYIIGQIAGPVEMMLIFLQSYQDTQLSIERLSEIHEGKNEDETTDDYIQAEIKNDDIIIDNLTFQYEGIYSPKVVNEVNLHIEAGKTTAIVGTSGSGKTTLVKLMLGFYPPTHGDISIGKISINQVKHSYWRSKCGVVMQDGVIFSDTIAGNIAMHDGEIDKERLYYSAKLSNVLDVVRKMPAGFNTKVGAEGIGLSQGQKQRILIARAIYKNPEYLFLDEATNALDASNEKDILGALEEFFENKTVVVVAHRLSTVKHADNIVVLEEGVLVEQGSHDELIKAKGKYFQLVKNQLELGG